jgi:hypothetical protein
MIRAIADSRTFIYAIHGTLPAGVNDGVNAYRYAFARRGPARLRGCARSCIVARRPAQGGATHTRSTGALRDSGARARRVPGACPPCSAATTAALIQRGPKKPRIPVFSCVSRLPPVFLNRGFLEDLNRTHGQANRYRARKKFLKKPPPRDDDSGRLAAMKQPRGSETNHAKWPKAESFLAPPTRASPALALPGRRQWTATAH